MSKQDPPKGTMNPRTRAMLYGLGALYLAHRYYQIAKPFLTRDPYGPPTLEFALGTLLFGGGAVALGALAWRLYKRPLPEADEPEGEEDTEAPDDLEDEEDRT